MGHGGGDRPGRHITFGAILIIALLYSIGAHGIMTLNDFKSEDSAGQTDVARPARQRTCRNRSRAFMLFPQVVVIALGGLAAGSAADGDCCRRSCCG